MSLLNFPAEITLQIVHKISLLDRINLSRVHSRMLPLCSDRLLDRNSTKTISLNELHQLYKEARTEKERDACSHPKILDRLRIKNVNEVVYLCMDPKNEQFIAKHNILQSLKGKIILKGESEKFSDIFFQTFLDLINRLDGNLFIAFLDVNFESFENMDLTDIGIIMSNKLELGDEVYVVNYYKNIQVSNDDIVWDILLAMDDYFTIYYDSGWHKCELRNHYIHLDIETSVENTKTLISMMDNDIFLELKQHLVKQILPILEERTATWQQGTTLCGSCDAETDLNSTRIGLRVHQPDWSNCTDCVLYNTEPYRKYVDT